MLCCVCFFFSVISQEIGCEVCLRNDPILCQVGRETLINQSYKQSCCVCNLYIDHLHCHFCILFVQVDKEVMILTSYETAMRTAHNFLAVFLAK